MDVYKEVRLWQGKKGKAAFQQQSGLQADSPPPPNKPLGFNMPPWIIGSEVRKSKGEGIVCGSPSLPATSRQESLRGLMEQV